MTLKDIHAQFDALVDLANLVGPEAGSTIAEIERSRRVAFEAWRDEALSPLHRFIVSAYCRDARSELSEGRFRRARASARRALLLDPEDLEARDLCRAAQEGMDALRSASEVGATIGGPESTGTNESRS